MRESLLKNAVSRFCMFLLKAVFFILIFRAIVCVSVDSAVMSRKIEGKFPKMFSYSELGSGLLLSLDSLQYRDFRLSHLNESGGFRLPFEPGSRQENLLQISGGRAIGRFHLAGSFGFSYADRRKLYLVHNNNPYNGTPFLFADSSRGGFSLKGLILQSSLSHSLTENVKIGVVSFYRVDQQIKTVFPKSFINRRYITAGIFYRYGGRRFYLDTHLLYEDNQDQFLTTRYSMEQNRTPVFIRIRGLDMPLMSYGQTSEQRNQQVNGLFHSLKIRHLNPDGMSFKIELFNHLITGAIKDGLSDYILQGRWEGVFSVGNISINMKIDSKSLLSIMFGGAMMTVQGYHPELNLKIIENISREIGGECIYRINFPGEKSLWLGTIVSGGMMRRADSYNGILDYFPSRKFGMLTGFQTRSFSQWELSFSSRIWGEFQEKTEIFTERTGWYYNQITKAEEDYFSTDKLRGELSIKMQRGVFPDVRGMEFHLFRSSATGRDFSFKKGRTELEFEIFRNLP